MLMHLLPLAEFKPEIEPTYFYLCSVNVKLV